MPVQKIICKGEEWHKKMKSGAEQIGELVGNTLGPSGRNVAITRKYRSPMVTNDGVSVARETYLEDEVEDIAAQIIVEISMKTNEQAGDGTTSSVVEAVALVLDCLERMEGGTFGATGDAMDLFRTIQAEKPKVLELLEKMAVKVGPKELRDIIVTSLENREFAEKIAEMIEAVGEDGYVSVEDNFDTKYGIETETINGMKHWGTYVTPYMVNAPRKQAIWEDALVLITNEHIDHPNMFSNFAKELKESKHRRLIVIAEKFETAAIQAFAAGIRAAREKGMDAVQVLAIKAPSLTTEEFQDLATYVEATFFDKNTGATARNAAVTSLGFIKKCVVDSDEMVLTGGTGDTSIRITALKEDIEAEKDSMFKAKKIKRLASLSAGIGIIRVGAMTEQERTYWKHKIEDAVHAARAAQKEGYVPGAGRALSAIADELGAESVLYKMLKAPEKRIKDNAGGSIQVPDWVVDPVKVVRLGFENACSAASTLITTHAGITEKRKTILDLLEEQLMPEEDDFREYAERRQP